MAAVDKCLDTRDAPEMRRKDTSEVSIHGDIKHCRTEFDSDGNVNVFFKLIKK